MSVTDSLLEAVNRFRGTTSRSPEDGQPILRQLAPAAYRGRQWLFLAGVMAVGVAVPYVFGGDAYTDGLLNQVLINAILAFGFYWCFSLGGQFTFAAFAMYACGSYVSVVGSKHLPGGFWAGFLLAILVTAIIGAATRLVFFKLGPIFFAIATMAIGGLMLIVFREWTGLTGGYYGVGDIPKPVVFGLVLNTLQLRYFLILAVLGVFLAATIAVIRSSAMRDLAFARDRRFVAATAGIRTSWVTLVPFIVGSAMQGAAGSLYAHNSSYFSLEAFDISISLNVLLIVLLGGVRSIYGPLMGAAVLILLPEFLRDLQQYSDLIYAGVILLIVVLFPDGIAGIRTLAGGWLRARRR